MDEWMILTDLHEMACGRDSSVPEEGLVDTGKNLRVPQNAALLETGK
jgi:hypothetical protein